MIEVWQCKMVFENALLKCETPAHRRHYHSHLGHNSAFEIYLKAPLL